MSEKTIRAECSFHAIGQGLFYSCILRSQYNCFSCVYDCGSKTNINILYSEIDKFIDMLPKSRDNNKKKCLDLLVLSHLDYDHINGLEYLLQKLHIETIILPYLTPEELLVLFANSNDSSAFIQSFYSHSVNILLAYDIRNIILLNEDDIKRNENDSSENTPPQKKKILNDKEYINANEISNVIIEAENFDEKKIGDSTLIKIQSKSAIISTDFFAWKFEFFNVSINKENLMKFFDNIQKFLNDNNIESIRDITSNYQYIKLFRRTYVSNNSENYEKIWENFNSTSIIMCHFPTTTEAILIGEVPHDIYNACYLLRENNIKKITTLLTGDTEINLKEYHLNKFTYKDYSFDIGVLSVPHHGSKKNWNVSLWIDELHSLYYVISYGTNNTYGHPSYDVVMDINRSHKILKLVNENKEFAYTIIAKYQ